MLALTSALESFKCNFRRHDMVVIFFFTEDIEVGTLLNLFSVTVDGKGNEMID